MHTKGPWTIREDKGHRFSNGDVDYGGFRIDAPGIEQLAYVWRSNTRFGSGEPFGAQEADANARVIAAAPDFHAAAVIAIVELEAVEREIGIPSKALPLLRAAIARCR